MNSDHTDHVEDVKVERSFAGLGIDVPNDEGIVVTVDESIREENRSDDEEKDESNENVICQLLDQRTASQRRDKSCAPSH